MMGTLLEDLRFSLRTLRKSPGFTAMAVLTIALGIGANSAIFSIINSMLLRPLPVAKPGQITVLEFPHGHGYPAQSISYLEYEHMRQQADSPFSGVLGWELGTGGLRVDGKNYQLLVSYVLPGFFQTLGVDAAYGRVLLPSEGKTPGADPVIVFGYGFWHGRLGADPHIVGQKVLVNGHPFTVAGVAAKDFHGLLPMVDFEAYVPYAMYVSLGGPPDLLTSTKNDNVHVLGRLRPQVTVEQARAALAVEANRLAEQFPDRDKNLNILVFPERLSRPDPQSAGVFLVVSGLFLVLAELVLVLACVNVANLLLVRATVRQREMAIRVALGGARMRLMRLLLTESILLALLGGAAGVLLGAWGSRAVSSINLHTTLPLAIDFSFDWRVFGFSFLAALLTGILVGLVPAIRASRTDLIATLCASGRAVTAGRHRLRNALVAVQVAGSLMLLVVAVLFARSMAKAQHIDLGFKPQGLVDFSMDPNGIGYDDQQAAEFYDQMLSRVRALPGVESASVAFAVPFGYYNSVTTLEIDGYQPPPGQGAPTLNDNYVSAGYFENLGIPILRGRDFNDADKPESQQVAIINEAAARKYWPHQDPLGRQFKTQDDRQQGAIEVVGLVRDSRYDDLSGAIEPFIYLPFSQHLENNALRTLQVRAAGDPKTIVASVQETIAGMAPTLPVFDVHTMVDGLDTINGLLMFQLGAALAATMGLLGLLLAIVGVYGVVSYATNQRTHEIGIRVALGAHPDQIVKLVLRQGLGIVSIGLGIGLLAALAAGRVVGRFLVGVSAADPVTFISVSLVLAGVALFACWIPARRAMRVDPAVALRHE
jgi:predicted permease